jgi:hypothetical protein
MTDKPSYQDRLRSMLHVEKPPAHPQRDEPGTEEGEASTDACGFLRGLRDQSSSLELRLRDGSYFFPYVLMGVWKYLPSEGLLLKFNADLLYVVLIRGSNLDKPLKVGSIDLTHALQRHRVLWIKEMTQEEIRKVGETGPTIDRILVAQLESNAEVKEWIGKHAPAFLE